MSTFPLPPFYNPKKVREVWRVPYQECADAAIKWAAEHSITNSSKDTFRISLLLVDVQNTFCIPDFELFVAGRSGTGAVDDNKRLCEFIYRNLGTLTRICPTMDSHQAAQIFHNIFLINDLGEHPAPYTLIKKDDIEKGIWKFNPDLAESLKISVDSAQKYLQHYTRQLKKGGKYDLTIWPYHAMLGGIGHALVSSVEEAIFFHGIVRSSQPDFQLKGNNPFTENYSALRPEILSGPSNEKIAEKNTKFIHRLLNDEAVIIAGQAKSHCVAWTVNDLLDEILKTDKKLAEKIYLLEDCSSPVVIPGVIDYTEEADKAYAKFTRAGIHLVRSTDPIESWPGINL